MIFCVDQRVKNWKEQLENRCMYMYIVRARNEREEDKRKTPRDERIAYLLNIMNECAIKQIHSCLRCIRLFEKYLSFIDASFTTIHLSTKT